ncbi:hypothetical protein RFI_14401 [Reticulomyxa filosa]|uniref:C2H2-type domain-containing protein n=1 Tax=Reticulomyxa filosa TaxID=46433 RepID=X6NA51_RETFI|nr:hypothetical protein RFI_14401 [Reticulomyxa filosa]|eukprot:ETO22788.1 hypothetical protein RFI_14401 [Reticulomyxa filosa]
MEEVINNDNNKKKSAIAFGERKLNYKNDKELKTMSGEIPKTRANEESGRFVGLVGTSENTSEYKDKYAAKLNHRNAHDDGNSVKRHTCAYCQKELFNSTGLKHHIYTHTNAWPFRCCWPGCAKGTATKRDLMKHQRTHTGLFPLVVFTIYVELHTYINLWLMREYAKKLFCERPFVCDICNKKFTQSGVMHRHKKACAKKKMAKCLETTVFYKQNSEDSKREMEGSWLVKPFNNNDGLPDTFSSTK